MKKHPPPISIVRARELRRNATDAEKAMRRMLREHFGDARFREQVSLPHYIVDFASHRLGLVIEIDGGQHSAENDARRTETIEAEGYQVIRFWNNEVLGNIEGCYLRLASLVGRAHPHPAATRQRAAKSAHPSPIEGEEKE
ncbi:MAG: DUF559 domain-containing protein [Novosphingobium sp.]